MGAGTITSRLGALLFARTPGIDVQLVPFKGSAEIGQAVLAGTVDFAFDSIGTSLPLIQGGHYRALAKYGNRPLPILPDLPGLGVVAHLPGSTTGRSGSRCRPAGTPAPIIDKLHREVAGIYADPAVIAKLEKVGILAVGKRPPAEFVPSSAARPTLVQGAQGQWRRRTRLERDPEKCAAVFGGDHAQTKLSSRFTPDCRRAASAHALAQEAADGCRIPARSRADRLGRRHPRRPCAPAASARRPIWLIVGKARVSFSASSSAKPAAPRVSAMATARLIATTGRSVSVDSAS